MLSHRYGGFLGPTQIEIVVADIQVSLAEIQVSLLKYKLSLLKYKLEWLKCKLVITLILTTVVLFCSSLSYMLQLARRFTYTHRVSPCTPWYQGMFMLVFIHAEGPCSV